MNKLLRYLNALPPAQQADFAKRCGTTVGYLRKAISIGQALREALCINIERESAEAVLCDDLRTDVDWSYLRGTCARPSPETRGVPATGPACRPSLSPVGEG